MEDVTTAQANYEAARTAYEAALTAKLTNDATLKAAQDAKAQLDQDFINTAQPLLDAIAALDAAVAAS